MVCKSFLAKWFRRCCTFFLRLVLLGCVCGGILSSNSIAFGAEWSIEPTFRSEGYFYENLRLTTQPHRSVWAMKASPSVGLSYATEIFSLKAMPKFEYARYYSQDPIEKTFKNYFFPLSGSYKTEVDRLDLDVAIIRDNALFGELEETGVVTNFIPRHRRDVRGGWQRSVTERMTMQSSYQFIDVTYDETSGSTLRDYQVHTGMIGANYQWTEKTLLHSNAWYSNYHIPQNGFRSETPGLELGFSQRIFETLSFSGSGGLRYVWTTLDGNGQRIKDSNLVWLVNGSLDKEWERSRLTVGYSRSLNPSGIGVLFVTDRMNFSVDHQLTHALKASLRGTFSINETVGSSSDVSGVNTSRRVYWNVGPTVSWRVTEYWSLDFSYAYAQRKISGETAHSNNVMLGLTYMWPKWAVSR